MYLSTGQSACELEIHSTIHVLSSIELQTGALQLLPLTLKSKTLGAEEVRKFLYCLRFLFDRQIETALGLMERLLSASRLYKPVDISNQERDTST